MRYTHAIHERALDLLFALPTRERRRVLLECGRLARDPFLEPDYVRIDADGRPLSYVVRGHHVITYWMDHAARLIFIIGIDPADSG